MEQFTTGDLVVGGVILLSALAAMARGFTREILGLVALGVAAGAAYVLGPQVAPEVKQMVNLSSVASMIGVDEDMLAGIGAGASVFIVVWIIAVFIANWLSNMIVFSAAGALDRTLGFLFGMARGLFIMSVVFLVAQYLVYPNKVYPDWVGKARLLPVVEWAADAIDGVARGAVENWTGKELGPRTITAPPADAALAPAGDTTDGRGYNAAQTGEMDRAIGTLTQGTGTPAQ